LAFSSATAIFAPAIWLSPKTAKLPVVESICPIFTGLLCANACFGNTPAAPTTAPATAPDFSNPRRPTDALNDFSTDMSGSLQFLSGAAKQPEYLCGGTAFFAVQRNMPIIFDVF
jgi:hypothetical protein